MASQLAKAHITAMARLRAIVTQAVERAWTGLPGHDAVNVDEFLALAVPVVQVGQDQAVSLTDAYLAAALGRLPLGPDPAKLTGAAVRNGATPQEVYRRPFVTLWSGLKDGTQYQDALHAALARATSAAATDVQLSMRATAQAVQTASDGIFGYKRVADGNACNFCKQVNGAYIREAGAMPLHNHCGCGLEPITDEPHPGAVHLPDGTRIRDSRGGPLIDTPPPSDVAVHTHGELGPVLTDPTQHFTSQADL